MRQHLRILSERWLALLVTDVQSSPARGRDSGCGAVPVVMAPPPPPRCDNDFQFQASRSSSIAAQTLFFLLSTSHGRACEERCTHKDVTEFERYLNTHCCDAGLYILGLGFICDLRSLPTHLQRETCAASHKQLLVGLVCGVGAKVPLRIWQLGRIAHLFFM